MAQWTLKDKKVRNVPSVTPAQITSKMAQTFYFQKQEISMTLDTNLSSGPKTVRK